MSTSATAASVLALGDHSRVFLDTCNRASRDAVLARVRENLNDAGYFYSSDDFEDSIQDAYDEIVALAGALPKAVAINTVASKTYYDLRTLIPDFVALRGIYNARIRRWLIPKSMRWFETQRDDWELQTGEPEYFATVNYKYVAIYPRLATASGQYYVFYYASADTLSGSDVPQLITSAGEKALEYYVTADLYEQAEEWVKASEYWTLYVEEFSKVSDVRKNLRLPDFVDRLR